MKREVAVETACCGERCAISCCDGEKGVSLRRKKERRGEKDEQEVATVANLVEVKVALARCRRKDIGEEDKFRVDVSRSPPLPEVLQSRLAILLAVLLHRLLVRRFLLPCRLGLLTPERDVLLRCRDRLGALRLGEKGEAGRAVFSFKLREDLLDNGSRGSRGDGRDGVGTVDVSDLAIGDASKTGGDLGNGDDVTGVAFGELKEKES
jgi:hypothetical protein